MKMPKQTQIETSANNALSALTNHFNDTRPLTDDEIQYHLSNLDSMQIHYRILLHRFLDIKRILDSTLN